MPKEIIKRINLRVDESLIHASETSYHLSNSHSFNEHTTKALEHYNTHLKIQDHPDMFMELIGSVAKNNMLLVGEQLEMSRENDTILLAKTQFRIAVEIAVMNRMLARAVKLDSETISRYYHEANHEVRHIDDVLGMKERLADEYGA